MWALTITELVQMLGVNEANIKTGIVIMSI